MEIVWLTIISITALLFSGFVLFNFISTRSRSMSFEEQANGASWLMQHKLGNLGVESKTLENRLAELEARLQLMEERQDSTDLKAASEQPYRLAIKLAQKGVTAVELASTCGLTQGEAELLHMMHSKIRATNH